MRRLLLVASAVVLVGACNPTSPPTATTTTTTTVPGATTLAIAYSSTGDPLNDGLIARLVDTDGDGEVSVGDTVETDGYPLDVQANFFGTFGNRSHPVAEVVNDLPDTVAVRSSPGAGGDLFVWIDNTVSDQYRETANDPLAETYFVDHDGTTAPLLDVINVNPGSPSQPDESGGDSQAFPNQDDSFLDVELSN